MRIASSLLSIGVVYTNATGKPIEVCATAQSANAVTPAWLLPAVGGITIGAQYASDGVAVWGAARSSMCFVVPNSTTYTVNAGGTTLALIYWTELR